MAQFYNARKNLLVLITKLAAKYRQTNWEERMNNILKTSVKMAAMGAVMMGASAANAGVDFGKRGEAVNLVIGYQPYYTESWTGVVNNGKSFWKKTPSGWLYRRIPSWTPGLSYCECDGRREAAHWLHG